MHAFLAPSVPSFSVSEWRRWPQDRMYWWFMIFNERKRYSPLFKSIKLCLFVLLALLNHFHVWLLMAMLVNSSVLVTYLYNNACNDHANTLTWSFASCIVLLTVIVISSHLHFHVLSLYIYKILSILNWWHQSNIVLSCLCVNPCVCAWMWPWRFVSACARDLCVSIGNLWRCHEE